MHRRIETTLGRAKETSRFADRMVTIAKAGTLAARRELIRRLGSAEMAKVFIEEIAPRLQERNGGYTRVLKMGLRAGDGATRALVEFSVPIETAETKKKPGKEKKPKVKPLGEEKAPKKEEKRKEDRPEKAQGAAEKKETEKRGGFLSKLRRFLTGSEENK